MLPCAQMALDIMERRDKLGQFPNPYEEPPLWTHRVWRGDLLLHTSRYQAKSAEEARRDARHYFAWDRVTKVELVHPNGKIEIVTL